MSNPLAVVKSWASRAWGWLVGPPPRSAWDVYRDELGDWRWRLVAGNGEIIASGEAHTIQSDAIRAALTVDRVVRETQRRLTGVEGRTRL
jgi:uncharacterized protein YegP (UPF0339 family)